MAGLLKSSLLFSGIVISGSRRSHRRPGVRRETETVRKHRSRFPLQVGNLDKFAQTITNPLSVSWANVSTVAFDYMMI